MTTEKKTAEKNAAAGQRGPEAKRRPAAEGRALKRLKILYRSVVGGMAAVIVTLAALLTVFWIDSQKVPPIVTSAEDLKMMEIINQLLQDMVAPQLQGEQTLFLREGRLEEEKYYSSFQYADCRGVGPAGKEIGNKLNNWTWVEAEFEIEGSAMQVGDLQVKTSMPPEGIIPSGFYADFMVDSVEFGRNNVDNPNIDLFQLAVDESRLEDEAYRAEALARLNGFFGTNYDSADQWKNWLSGKCAIVFRTDPNMSREELLSRLAALDGMEGLNVAGVYYSNGPIVCKTLRPEETVSLATLDPRPELRLLNANRELADMLLASDLYGGIGFNFELMLSKIQYGGFSKAEICGACVVVDKGRFLTPEMAEAISQVSYRCFEVRLLNEVV